MVDDNKRAAKAFVESYFPPPSRNPASISEALAPPPTPNSTQETSRNYGSPGKPGKNVGNSWNGSPAAVIFCDTEPDPSLMSFGVNYGAREYYPFSANSASSSYEKNGKQKEKKDACDYTSPENSREWWQGSYNY